jgi:hypothetical protein
MPRQFIPFGEWLPDLPAFQNPGATVAKNVIPDANSYLPFPNQTLYSTSIGGVCRGAIVARDTSGNYFNYAGDASALYQATQLSWSNVSRLVGGAYAVPSEDYWEFAQFGNRLIAVNGATGDAPQAITVGAANFAVLAGAPPPAKHIATIRDFVVLGNISATAVSPQMVRWCAINNANSWTPDAATLADFQDLPGDGGWIQKIIGGEYGTIFQERAIFRMTFVGSPLIFQFDRVQTGIGAFAPQAAVGYRNFSFFLAEDGFYMFDGTTITPIGVGKVDRTFFSDLDITNIHRIHAVIDVNRKMVAWAYPGAGNIGGNPNKILIYSWAYRRWARTEDLNVELICRSVTGTYTLDNLDNVSGSIDALLFSLDDSAWRTGNYLLSAFNNSHRLTLFNGSAMPAVVETAEVQFNREPDALAYVTEVRPVLEGLSASATVAIATRNVNTESAGYATSQRPNSTGFVEARATGRFHRFRVATDDNTNIGNLLGVDVLQYKDGVR